MDTVLGAALNIGGTTTVLLVDGPEMQHPYTSEQPTKGNHPSLQDLVISNYQEAQNAANGGLKFLAIGVAGPVNRVTQEVRLTNVDHFANQTLAARHLRDLGLPVFIFNDLQASGRMLLNAESLHTRLLRGDPAPDAPNFVLLEIGTGLGTAYTVQNADAPHGIVIASELQHSHSAFGTSFERLLAGKSGFRKLLKHAGMLHQGIPEALREAMESHDLSPAVTAYILSNPDDPFAKSFLAYYGGILGEYCRNVQLAFSESTHIFVGGSIGRVPGFLELVLATSGFKAEFLDDKFMQSDVRTTMGISRIEDTDLTVRGVYASGCHVWNG